MIGHDTQMRDWIAVTAEARSRTVMRGVQFKTKPVSADLKKRKDDAEQRRQLRELIGTDPY
ncbi:hypothetical protein [Aquitalea aquatilis]|uniref:hypothetical protein n=1 Tax=Aquitalea aquatilis TaxID=1537400 RepID=UPI0010BDA01C|nr:hypothetical protein [Aquitalea aquatilis]